MEERPPSVARKPRPAPDEHRDPVDLDIAPTAPSAEVTEATAQPDVRTAPMVNREITVPVGSRIGQKYMEMIDRARATEGITQRRALEIAIEKAWGTR
ncbi:hypothetical protein ACKVM7_000160 [Arthrobacter russicus]|uniref:hypothetical protein n=1 Tax=Bacillati TaxID=1783272 RepID=UPI00321A49EE